MCRITTRTFILFTLVLFLKFAFFIVAEHFLVKNILNFFVKHAILKFLLREFLNDLNSFWFQLALSQIIISIFSSSQLFPYPFFTFQFANLLSTLILFELIL